MANNTPTLVCSSLSKNQVSSLIKVPSGGGLTQVQWDNSQSFTPLGQLVFFSHFLECSGLFESWVDSAPLSYKSNNAPEVKDVLGTLMLSVLVGHNRYCHISQLYGDKVCAEVLGLSKICSDDSSRRAMKRLDECEAMAWLDQSLKDSCEPMLSRDWILDLDSTVKPVFGHQEGAAIGYNPTKPGRPSYSVHSYFIANTRIALGVEVRPGTENAGKHTLPKLFKLLDSLVESQRPEFIRGDVSYGNENMMSECEKRGIDFIFKLKKSSNVKKLITRLEQSHRDWHNAGQGWQGQKATLRLDSWSRERQVLVLRRKKESKPKKQDPQLSDKQNEQLFFHEILPPTEETDWEYATVITSLDLPVMTLAQHYRDRGDCENNYDEYKNQWGWSGFTSKDLCSTRIMACIVALVANWWNVYARLAMPQKHAEAITTRPCLLNAVGRFVRHAGQRFIRISTTNAAAEKIVQMTCTVAEFLKNLTAAHYDTKLRWKAIIRRAFIFFEYKQALQTTLQIGQKAH